MVSCIHSPAIKLASCLLPDTPRGLYLISGASGAGKTQCCMAVVDQTRQLGLSVDGLLSPAVFADNQKVGIDLVHIQTGERRRLGVRYQAANAGLMVGSWRFDDAALAWGNHILQMLDDADVVILDELGPLEFKENGGFQAGLQLLDEHRYRTALVVIRPELLAVAKVRWPEAQVLDLFEDKE